MFMTEDKVREIIKEELGGVIRTELVDLVSHIFDRASSAKTLQWRGLIVPKTIRSKLVSSISASIHDRFKRAYEYKALDFVKGEDFIDSVVKRINDKRVL